jgi:murein peptide amidase A
MCSHTSLWACVITHLRRGVSGLGLVAGDDGRMRRRSAPAHRTATATAVAVAVVGATAILAPVGASASVPPGPAVVRTTSAPTAAATVANPAVAAAAVPSGYVCTTVRGSTVTYSCVIGRSVGGRSIIAQRQGNPTARRVLVVIGQMHGEEWPGPMSVDLIRRLPTPATASYQIWTVRTMNPDGGAIGRRRTNHGVDLNRNFPARFVRTSDSGPRALSEPESAAIARFLTWTQPDLVVSLHGFSEAVDTTGGGLRAATARTFSSLSRITPAHVVPCGGPCRGNMTDWYSATSKVGGVAFTVEMPRSSRVTRACGVPGHRRGTPIQCVAWAASSIASRLPR